MCGRFTLSKPKKVKAKDLRIKQEEVGLLKPRYNIAPSNNVAAVLNEKERHIEPLRWGLIPSWSKDESIGQRMINARSETLSEKPSFKGLFHKHRCLILADGFYEWAEEARGKQGKEVRLIAANKKYPPIKPKEELKVGGVINHRRYPEIQIVNSGIQ